MRTYATYYCLLPPLLLFSLLISFDPQPAPNNLFSGFALSSPFYPPRADELSPRDPSSFSRSVTRCKSPVRPLSAFKFIHRLVVQSETRFCIFDATVMPNWEFKKNEREAVKNTCSTLM
jgi:hypothetical protein